MMIFQHTWQAVMDGTKTQTRRIVKPDHMGYGFSRDEIIGIASKRKTRSGWNADIYVAGRDYAVQPGHGKSAIGRIRITAIRREDVRQISDADVKAEGFDSRADFLRLWEQMHGSYYDAWALTFERVA